MAQVNQQSSSFDPTILPVKRKRGRPRKDEFPGSEPGVRTQRRRSNPISSSGNGLVGQTVSGVLDGTFDAGFLLTVRVGSNGPLFRGMVFDPRLSVPVSPGNDVAPHLPMSKRDGIPVQVAEGLSQARAVEPLQRHQPVSPNPVVNHVHETGPSRLHQASPPLNAQNIVVNDATVQTDKPSKGSGTILKGSPAAGSAKVSPPNSCQPSESEASNALNAVSVGPSTVSKESEASNARSLVPVGPSTVSKEEHLETHIPKQHTVEEVETAEENTIPRGRKVESPSRYETGSLHTVDVSKEHEILGDEMQVDSIITHQSYPQPQNLKAEPTEMREDEESTRNAPAAVPEASTSQETPAAVLEASTSQETPAAVPEASTSQENPEILQETKAASIDNGSRIAPSCGGD